MWIGWDGIVWTGMPTILSSTSGSIVFICSDDGHFPVDTSSSRHPSSLSYCLLPVVKWYCTVCIAISRILVSCLVFLHVVVVVVVVVILLYSPRSAPVTTHPRASRSMSVVPFVNNNHNYTP